MVAKGYPNKVIARVLEISSWTVSTHLRRIFAKLGVTTRASMVARLMDRS
jgi:DNA-binding CsgD family transcriptional regulator